MGEQNRVKFEFKSLTDSHTYSLNWAVEYIRDVIYAFRQDIEEAVKPSPLEFQKNRGNFQESTVQKYIIHQIN